MFCAGLFASLKTNLNNNNPNSSNQVKNNSQSGNKQTDKNNNDTHICDQANLPSNSTLLTARNNSVPAAQINLANIPEESVQDNSSSDNMAASVAALPPNSASASALAAFTSARPMMTKLMCKSLVDCVSCSDSCMH
jgi:hypothetical protein